MPLPAFALIVLPLWRKYWPYLAVLAVIILIAIFAVRIHEGIKESGRVEGRAEVEKKWSDAKAAQAEETAKLIANAVAVERANFKTIQEEKEKGDVEKDKLSAAHAALQRDYGRLRVSRETICKRKPNVSGTAASVEGSSKPSGAEANGSGLGEIDLDDVAAEIGKLGAALDSERNYIKYDLMPIIRACDNLRSKR